MKIKILLSLIFFGSINLLAAQIIQNFDSFPMSKYNIVSSPSEIDNSPSGINAVWNFNSLSTSGDTLEDTYSAPTAQQLIDYPNTTSVQKVIPTPTPPPAPDPGAVIRDGINSVFTEKNISNLVSLTGIERDSLVLNFNGDNTRAVTPINPVPPNDDNGNAVIGFFPMAYGTNNTADDVSGDFIFYGDPNEIGTLTGFFEGTITTSVDAYGTLNTNDFGNGAYNAQVTRLKILQVLRLSIFKITAEQLSYYYYDTSSGNLLFRYSKLLITSTGSFVSDSESIIMEHLDTSTLSTNGNRLGSNGFNIYPNPVKNNLNFNLSEGIKIKSFIVSDITGRQVINGYDTNALNVSHLKAGVYLMSAITNKGLISRKFIKE